MKILLIDNYDSFTFNLYHYLSSLNTNVEVFRNDKISSKDIIRKKYKKIIISPGPGNPNQTGNCLKIVKDLDLSENFITSKAEAKKMNSDNNLFKLEGVNDRKVLVKKAKGKKCSTCWKILETPCNRGNCGLKN